MDLKGDLNFSLNRDDVLMTPIKPDKIEQLFHPNLRTPSGRLSNVTYQIQAASTPEQIFVDPANDTCLNLNQLDINFPRHSTSIKTNPRLQFQDQGSPDIVPATNNPQSVPNEQPIDCQSFEDSNFISACPAPQYKPLYRINDSKPFRATCFHPKGDVFLVGSNTQTLRVCSYISAEDLSTFTIESDPVEPEVLYQFVRIHRSSVYCVAFNQSGNLLATGSNDQTVHVVRYDPETHLPTDSEYMIDVHSGTIRDVCFMHNNENESPVESLLSAGAHEDGIFVTDCQTMKVKQSLQGHSATIMSLHSWGDPNLFVSACLDSKILMWDLRARRQVAKMSTKSPGGDVSSGQSGVPACVCRVDPTGRLLVSGHKDGRCMLFDIKGNRVLQLFKGHEDEVRTVNFSPNSYYLLSGSFDRKVKLTDIQGDLTRKLPSVEIAELGDKVVQTAWHPQEYTFVTTSADGTATLWAMPEVSSMPSSIRSSGNMMADLDDDNGARYELGSYDDASSDFV